MRSVSDAPEPGHPPRARCWLAQTRPWRWWLANRRDPTRAEVARAPRHEPVTERGAEREAAVAEVSAALRGGGRAGAEARARASRGRGWLGTRAEGARSRGGPWAARGHPQPRWGRDNDCPLLERSDFHSCFSYSPGVGRACCILVPTCPPRQPSPPVRSFLSSGDPPSALRPPP